MKHSVHMSSHQQKVSFYIGDIPVYGDVILSPMDGFSDLPFRSLCRELGSAMSYTEFVRAEDVLAGNRRTLEKLAYREDERPVVFQLYGEEPQTLLEAALRVQEMQPDVIDINMGCPSKTVANRGAGVGLMRTPLKIARIFRLLTSRLEVPVTAKIRLGWDETCQPYLLVARIVEENGGALLAVHGRTKAQGYSGSANWDAIAEIREHIRIPLLGNGDVKRVDDIERMKRYTGCDGVLIGRAAIRNPWIFAYKDREQVLPEQVRALVLRHLARNIAFYGEELGVILFRKNVVRYIAPYRLPRDERVRLLTCNTRAEFEAVLDSLYKERISAEQSSQFA